MDDVEAVGSICRLGMIYDQGAQRWQQRPNIKTICAESCYPQYNMCE